MSRHATDWAWLQPLKAPMKLVLLAFADRADEDHCAWPSIPRVERDTGLNEKTIRKHIHAMVEMGLLVDSGRRKGRTKQIIVYQLVGVEDRKIYTLEPDDDESPPNVKPYQNRKPTKNGRAKAPKIGRAKTTKFGRQNQSLEPPIEPKDLLSNNQTSLDRLILGYLNEKRKQVYRKLNLTTRDLRVVESNLKPIRTILKAKYSMEQIRLVIDHLMWRWGHDPQMRGYLTVDSIFRSTKFESKLEWALEWRDNAVHDAPIPAKPAANDPEVSPSEEFRQYLRSQGKVPNF